ncbi:MAG TPA: SulP family inorganic anion transporter, partial [Planctomycetaceae bacterium]|nr:SulP family inorganic anion transporter [Planctomycetaceae bacterium]
FAGLLARRDLWYAVAMGVIMLTMIDGVESLATAMAIDRIDPYRRRSSPNRVLLAMAISNVASSLVGG